MLARYCGPGFDGPGSDRRWWPDSWPEMGGQRQRLRHRVDLRHLPPIRPARPRRMRITFPWAAGAQSSVYLSASAPHIWLWALRVSWIMCRALFSFFYRAAFRYRIAWHVVESVATPLGGIPGPCWRGTLTAIGIFSLDEVGSRPGGSICGCLRWPRGLAQRYVPGIVVVPGFASPVTVWGKAWSRRRSRLRKFGGAGVRLHARFRKKRNVPLLHKPIFLGPVWLWCCS